MSSNLKSSADNFNSNAVYSSMIEVQVLNYIINSNSMQFVTLNSITEDYFTTYKEHFKFLVDYYSTYNQMPSKQTIQGKFSETNFEWITVTDPEEYLIKKLREQKLWRDLVVSYNKLTRLIKNCETDKAISMMGAISQQFLKQESGKCIDLIGDASVRYNNYLEKVENQDKAFITTGIKELDDILGGWDMQNETAIIAARTGVGKSWWLIKFALEAAKKGLNVGFYSGEMDADLVGYRLDTFMGNIPNGSLTHGNDNIKNTYTSYIDSLNKLIDGHIYCITPDMIDGSATVSKLKAFIEKFNIQFLCIDQFSLLEDERRGKTPREQMCNLSKDLRTLQRLKKIPILAAAQLNREDISVEGPSTRNISESDRIGQDATTVLFFEKKNDTLVITVGKARNARTGDKLTYQWSINMGILNYIPSESDARRGEGVDVQLDMYNDSQKSNSVF